MAKGIRATRKQASAGRKNLSKAHVNRAGKRGMHYRKKF